MPIDTSSDLQAQYEAATGGAGLVDLSERGKVEVAGPDAAEYLQGQITNDVEALSPGQGCYAAMLTPKGRIVSDARVLVRADDSIWLDVEEVALAATLRELRTYKIGRQVEIHDRSDECALLSLVGGHSQEIARAAAGDTLPASEHGTREVEIGGRDVVVAKTAFGFDLFCASTDKDSVHATLVTAGATPVGERAIDLVRIEAGVPRFDVDMSSDNLPGEAGIVDRAVSFTKGCYVGQEPVARMFHKGHPNRHLRGLRLSQPAAIGAVLTYSGREVGHIGTIGVSPKHGPIALAIVRKEAEPGSELAVEGSDARATVVELPFGGN